jgi:hypothetical protein
MAHVTQNFWGFVIILDHQEADQVAGVAEDVARVVNTLGEMLEDTDLALIGSILELVAFGISLNAWLIQEVDHGNGVYLTTPYAALGTIIPTTRAANIGLGPDWVQIGSREFRTEDAADLLTYQVQLDAVGLEAVEFALESSSPGMWRKVLVMRDGGGSQWDIAIDPSQGISSAGNGLWSDQVGNGQPLSLWKAKEFGVMTWVLDIRNLQTLPPGSRTVFTWVQD